VSATDLKLPVRVFVIDDDEVDREIVRHLLPRAGIEAEVLEADDPAVALATLREQGTTFVELIVLDYHFPREDGLAVLRALRELDTITPVIVLTGQDDVALAVELMKNGAADYIPKGALTSERLGRSVRHALRLRGLDLAARAAQEALRASEEFNRRVLEASADCIKVLDLDGRLVSMSAGGHRLMQIPEGTSMAGKLWLEFWSEDQQVAAMAAFTEARSGGVGHFVGHCAATSGATLWWDVVISPIQGAGGLPERILAISRDVTKQKRQAEFEQQLIGIVSHDLRNPIAAMIMGASLIKLKTTPDSPLASTAGRIVKSGERATRLIRDLLDFTQVRLGGGVPIERRAADIHVVCAQAVEEIALNYPDRIIIREDEGDGHGAWDADRLAQVVGNLVRNAVSYGEPGAPITVSSVGRATTVEIRVHNHGKPIAPDVLPTLFEPFKRGDRRHDPERSVGLGLFIVREIVAAHGGTVEVCSEVEQGTCFSVTLPRGA
jgi:PAS domain S-box-containing protein